MPGNAWKGNGKALRAKAMPRAMVRPSFASRFWVSSSAACPDGDLKMIFSRPVPSDEV